MRRKFRNGKNWLSYWIYRFTVSILQSMAAHAEVYEQAAKIRAARI